MKKVSMSITMFPEVYAKVVESITSGRHRSENELIDAALRQYLDIDQTAPVEDDGEDSDKDSDN